MLEIAEGSEEGWGGECEGCFLPSQPVYPVWVNSSSKILPGEGFW